MGAQKVDLLRLPGSAPYTLRGFFTWFKVEGLGFKVLGLGFRSHGFGFRV